MEVSVIMLRNYFCGFVIVLPILEDVYLLLEKKENLLPNALVFNRYAPKNRFNLG